MMYIPNCYMIIKKKIYCGTIQSSTDPDLTLARTLTLSIHDYDFDHFSCSRCYATNIYMFVIFIHHTSQLAIKKPKSDFYPISNDHVMNIVLYSSIYCKIDNKLGMHGDFWINKPIELCHQFNMTQPHLGGDPWWELSTKVSVTTATGIDASTA